MEASEEASKQVDMNHDINMTSDGLNNNQQEVKELSSDRSAGDEEELASELSNESGGASQEPVKVQRFKRLQHLLEKSSVYSTFMLQQMERQKEEEKSKSSRKERRRKQVDIISRTHVMETRRKQDPSSNSDKTKPNKGPAKRTSTRQRKRQLDESYNVSDFIDQQGCLIKMTTDDDDKPSAAVIQEVLHKEGGENWKIDDGRMASYRQPKLVTGGLLRDYQLDGLDWLRVLYENGVNGILADEMGLGKTIQCIGLISSMITNNVSGPFLIVAPLSTVPNWVAEFSKFAPTVLVVLYHGSIKEREALRRKHLTINSKNPVQELFPVIITSYEIAMRDKRFIQNKPWKYLIVDEGHRIKNLNCRLIRDLKAFTADNRLLLTGTPLQNNLAELWSLLNFLLPDIFDDLNCFETWFDFSNDDSASQIVDQEKEHHVLSMLHQILSPFLLRRLKTDVEFNLPPKKEVLVYAPLVPKQAEYYKATLERTIFEMIEANKKSQGVDEATPTDPNKKCPTRASSERAKKRLKFDFDDRFDAAINGDLDWHDLLPPAEPEVTKKQSSILNIRMQNRMMQLRKCVNHPYLLEFPLTADGDFKIDEEVVNCSGKMLLLDRMLPALLRDGHKVLIFSQMTFLLDILEDYLDLRELQYSRLDGSMSFTVRQEQIKLFQEDPDVCVFLLSTRAGGLGINLTAADTVIIYDSDWNPQQDLQAQDRCHRIGQTRPVMVYRYITSNTIDQRIIETAAGKRKLEKMVIHKGKFKTGQQEKESDAISADKLYELLLQSDHDRVITSDHPVLSDKVLEALLDRGMSPNNGDNPLRSDTKENYFKVLQSSDTSGKDLQGINACTISDHDEAPLL